ncbi:MAG: AI-2E family transporter [Methanobacteriota archaeon]
MRLAIRRNTLLILLLIFAVVTFLVLRPWMAYILFGLALGFVVRPVYARAARRAKKPNLMALIFMLTTLLALVVPFLWLGWQVADDAIRLASGFSTEEAEVWLNSTSENGEPSPFARQVVTHGVPALQGLLATLGTKAVGVLAGLAVGLFISMITMYYTLRDGDGLVHWALSVSPLDPRREENIVTEAGATLRAVFLGQLAASLSQGIAGGIGFFLFGVPNFFFWAFAMMITSVLPIVGPAIIWLPASLYLFIAKGPVYGVGLLVYSLVVISNVDNIVRGRVVGQASGLHPGLTAVAAIGGLTFFGFVGFLMGPLAIAIFLLLAKFWREEFVEAHGLNPIVQRKLEAEERP